MGSLQCCIRCLPRKCRNACLAILAFTDWMWVLSEIVVVMLNHDCDGTLLCQTRFAVNIISCFLAPSCTAVLCMDLPGVVHFFVMCIQLCLCWISGMLIVDFPTEVSIVSCIVFAINFVWTCGSWLLILNHYDVEHLEGHVLPPPPTPPPTPPPSPVSSSSNPCSSCASPCRSPSSVSSSPVEV